jgi:tRNA dimethylallyltransferase
MQLPPILVIFGPTGVGKTSLAVDLALRFNGEIVSADSRQFFREMSIGTAKPTIEEMRGVKHHFINSLSISDTYTAGKFETDALQCISEIHESGKLPIVAGGSGLYIKALLEGIDNKPSNPELREELNSVYQNEGLDALRVLLGKLNPVLYNEIDPNNHMRIIRAIEISSHDDVHSDIKKIRAERTFRAFKIGLEMSRTELYQRIDERVGLMMASGLEEEAKRYFSERHLQAFNTVGYKELFAYMAGEYSRDRAIELIKRNSRRYAKRQLTWMRSESDLKWFDVKHRDIIYEYVARIIVDHEV